MFTTNGLSLPVGLFFFVAISHVYCQKRRRPCRICRKDGPDESGPVRRDCNCGGNSGFAHFSCMVKDAEHRSRKIQDADDCQSFIEPWEICPVCRHEYHGEVLLRLASHCMSFVANNYQQPQNRWRYVEALYLKLEALIRMARGAHLDQGDDAKEITKAVIYVIGQMKSDNPTLPEPISFLEADAQDYLGDLLAAEGSKDEAVGAYEKCRDIYKEVGYDIGAGQEDSKIINEKSKVERERIIFNNTGMRQVEIQARRRN